MPALVHTFAAGLRAETELCYAVDTRWNMLHLTQSALDSACGLHCVCMALMILIGIRRCDIERLSTSKHPLLQSLWERAGANWFEGSNANDISRYVDALRPTVQLKRTSSRTPLRIAESASAIEAGAVPLLRVSGKGLDHWVLVTGFEQELGGTAPRALLLLDPAAPAPWLAHFNARLDLGVRRIKAGRRSTTNALRYADGERRDVLIEDVVILSRGQPP